MFTTMQSMQVAREIQADHRRRATSWRFARRAHRRARHPELDAPTASLGPFTPYVPMATITPLVPPRAGAPAPVTNVA